MSFEGIPMVCITFHCIRATHPIYESMKMSGVFLDLVNHLLLPVLIFLVPPSAVSHLTKCFTVEKEGKRGTLGC